MNTNKNAVLSFISSATNIRPILDKLNQGRIVRNVIGVYVQANTLLLGLLTLSVCVASFALLSQVNFLGGAAVLLWVMFLLYATFLCMKVLFIRGKEIRQLPDSEFTVSPIIATMITTAGEMVFITLAVMSLPAMLVVWMAGDVAYAVVPLTPGSGVFAGIMVFIACWIAGFLFYLISRWIREWTLAIFSIARNVDLISRNDTSSEQN